MTTSRVSNTGSNIVRLHSGNEIYPTGGDISVNKFSNNLTPFRNVITNGNMQVFQRAFYKTTWMTTGTVEYSVDRWAHRFQALCYVTPSGGSPIPGSTTVWLGYAGASSTYLEMGQQIEFADCGHLQNQTVTISFWAKAFANTTASKALTVRTRTGSTENAVVLFTGTASDNSVTLTTSWARYTVTKTLPSTFGALSLEFALANIAASDGFYITGIQMELGSYASDFEQRSWWTEYKMCRRFYQLYTSATATNKKYAFASYAASTTSFYINKFFTESLWSRPTQYGVYNFSVWVPTVASFYISSTTLLGSTTHNATIKMVPTSTAGLASGYCGIVDSNGSASTYMWFGADF